MNCQVHKGDEIYEDIPMTRESKISGKEQYSGLQQLVMVQRTPQNHVVYNKRLLRGFLSSALDFTHAIRLWKTGIILDSNFLSFLQVLFSSQDVFCLILRSI